MKALFLTAALTFSALGASAHDAATLFPLQVRAVEGAPVLAGPSGFTIYTFDNDTTSESTCYDGCAKAWPPVLVTSTEGIVKGGPIGTTTRKDGQLQITISGLPVYYYVGDSSATDTVGDGIGGVWHLINN